MGKTIAPLHHNQLRPGYAASRRGQRRIGKVPDGVLSEEDPHPLCGDPARCQPRGINLPGSLKVTSAPSALEQRPQGRDLAFAAEQGCAWHKRPGTVLRDAPPVHRCAERDKRRALPAVDHGTPAGKRPLIASDGGGEWALPSAARRMIAAHRVLVPDRIAAAGR